MAYGDPINIDPTQYAYGTDPTQPIGGLPAGLETPSQIKRRQRLAENLLQNAGDTSPKGSWTQVLAQTLGGYLGGREQRKADAADKARTAYIAQALQGGATPEELQNLGITMEDPSMIQVAGQNLSAAEAKRRDEAALAQNQAETDRANRAYALQLKQYERGNQMTPYQQEELKLQQDRLAFDKTKGPGGFGAGATIMNAKAISTAADAPWKVLSANGTPDNPVPIIDSLASGSSATAQIAGELASKYGGQTAGNIASTNLMSKDAQAAASQLKVLTQLYIYTLSGKQANDPEVQRLLGAAMPVYGEDPNTTRIKKLQIAGMYNTIKEKAGQPPSFADQSQIQLPDPNAPVQPSSSSGSAIGTSVDDTSTLPDGTYVQDDQGNTFVIQGGKPSPVQ